MSLSVSGRAGIKGVEVSLSIMDENLNTMLTQKIRKGPSLILMTGFLINVELPLSFVAFIIFRWVKGLSFAD